MRKMKNNHPHISSNMTLFIKLLSLYNYPIKYLTQKFRIIKGKGFCDSSIYYENRVYGRIKIYIAFQKCKCSVDSIKIFRC